DYLSRSGKPGNSDNTLPFLTVRLKRMVLERIPNCKLGDFRRFFGNHTAISPVQGQKPKNRQYTRDGKQQQVWHQATHGQQFTPRYVAAKKMQSVATTGNHFPMLSCQSRAGLRTNGLAGAMGYNARNDEIRDNVTRMRREREAQRGGLATVRRFNATLSAKGYVWFWPKIS